ncbi:MAG: asparagine synthase (glutamine-hydrolyzing) [Bryobacteraceae bacterium]
MPNLCGIAGFTHSSNIEGRKRIEDAVRSLVHRGPDQQGIFTSESVSVGATRLKIIDLDGGDQPILSDDGSTVIVFNGEIYNHAELRQELESLGHRFRSRTDTETVLHAFMEWDTRCFQRLRGMFAVALWVEPLKRLLLARDRLGIKPLYFARKGKALFFGSEIKAILVHPEIERQLSLTALDCYLSLNYVPCPWTLVEGIEKLPPGHYLEWTEGQIRHECYWHLPRHSGLPWPARQAREELHLLLQQSMCEHLISDVSLGVWLSGGIDSSTILHYASAASSSSLKTFSISFHGHTFDESKYIHKAVEAYGTDHQEFDLNPGTELQDAIEEFAYYSDDPVGDAGALPVWFLSKLTKGHATVVLSGEGADELFGGYLTYRADQLSDLMRKLPRFALEGALALSKIWPVSDEKIGFDYKLRRFFEGCRMPPGRAHVHWNGTFSEPEKRDLLNLDLPERLSEILAELAQVRPDLAEYLWFDQKYYLPDDILAKVDRISMAHSLEVRPPFLDHRIVEFAASLPSHLKIEGSCQKVILKDLMKDKLCAFITSRKKVGFDIPAHQWLRGPLKKLLLDTLLSDTHEYTCLFRQSALESLVRRHLDRRINVGYHLWGLMILFLWMRKWRIRI